jgi:hypothetical protein
LGSGRKTMQDEASLAAVAEEIGGLSVTEPAGESIEEKILTSADGLALVVSALVSKRFWVSVGWWCRWVAFDDSFSRGQSLRHPLVSLRHMHHRVDDDLLPPRVVALLLRSSLDRRGSLECPLSLPQSHFLGSPPLDHSSGSDQARERQLGIYRWSSSSIQRSSCPRSSSSSIPEERRLWSPLPMIALLVAVVCALGGLSLLPVAGVTLPCDSCSSSECLQAAGSFCQLGLSSSRRE